MSTSIASVCDILRCRACPSSAHTYRLLIVKDLLPSCQRSVVFVSAEERVSGFLSRASSHFSLELPRLTPSFTSAFFAYPTVAATAAAAIAKREEYAAFLGCRQLLRKRFFSRARCRCPRWPSQAARAATPIQREANYIKDAKTLASAFAGC